MRAHTKMNAVAYALMVKDLMIGASYADLAESTGIGHKALIGYVRALHKAECVFICGWDPDARMAMTRPVFKLGTGRDKPRPRRSNADIKKAHRVRQKQALQLGLLERKEKVCEQV